MIPRYSRPEMVAIWSPETKFRIWFEIEAHAADALAELGVIPKDAAKTIWAKAKDATFDVARIDEIERETKHDVIAFLTHLAEIVGPEARFVHQGMTSSDVLDLVDLVLVMSVNPGFGGQAFIPAMINKVTDLRAMLAGRPIDIEVDGGVVPDVAAKLAAAGANALVAGSAVFKGGTEASYKANIDAIRHAAAMARGEMV
jgi:hypothetical protein